MRSCWTEKTGERSFGVVFRGTFKCNGVVVKFLKMADVSPDAVAEFERVVALLDKFRCEQIDHFGVYVIPTKVCMVTEFAPCGSLMDCIGKRAQPDLSVKAKVVLEAALCLAYLHTDWIFFRDIKPDNVFVFAFDAGASVSPKLTDFGSSRNDNLLMSNMTFTKGVGTPTNMAPEILKRRKTRMWLTSSRSP